MLCFCADRWANSKRHICCVFLGASKHPQLTRWTRVHNPLHWNLDHQGACFPSGLSSFTFLLKTEPTCSGAFKSKAIWSLACRSTTSSQQVYSGGSVSPCPSVIFVAGVRRAHVCIFISYDVLSVSSIRSCERTTARFTTACPKATCPTVKQFHVGVYDGNLSNIGFPSSRVTVAVNWPQNHNLVFSKLCIFCWDSRRSHWGS